jgi:hypothetical protein
MQLFHAAKFIIIIIIIIIIDFDIFEANHVPHAF